MRIPHSAYRILLQLSDKNTKSTNRRNILQKKQKQRIYKQNMKKWKQRRKRRRQRHKEHRARIAQKEQRGMDGISLLLKAADLIRSGTDFTDCTTCYSSSDAEQDIDKAAM